jgi:hypothetical protein
MNVENEVDQLKYSVTIHQHSKQLLNQNQTILKQNKENTSTYNDNFVINLLVVQYNVQAQE